MRTAKAKALACFFAKGYDKFGFMGEFGLAKDAPNESLHLSVTKEL